MKKTAQFIKDTLVGGVLFLLPGALLLWLAEKVLPLARQLPEFQPPSCASHAMMAECATARAG